MKYTKNSVDEYFIDTMEYLWNIFWHIHFTKCIQKSPTEDELLQIDSIIFLSIWL